jgi:SAM-dependent methyltransferase
MDSRLVQRDKAEIVRSAAEARKAVLTRIPPDQVARYLNPDVNTPFPLEYAFYLLGDVSGKTVVDLGCGQGENIVPLVARGARVLGIDISPDLITIAGQRLRDEDSKAAVSVGSAYETGLPSGSVDVIFCVALIHHLDIKIVCNEMLRVLRPGGMIILSEPIRFSKVYNWLRHLLLAQDDISEFEHPLTQHELAIVTEPFKVEAIRYFRLPFVPLISRTLPAAWKTSDWALRHWPALKRYATVVVTRLRKTSEALS